MSGQIYYSEDTNCDGLPCYICKCQQKSDQKYFFRLNGPDVPQGEVLVCSHACLDKALELAALHQLKSKTVLDRDVSVTITEFVSKNDAFCYVCGKNLRSRSFSICGSGIPNGVIAVCSEECISGALRLRESNQLQLSLAERWRALTIINNGRTLLAKSAKS
jgi:hypothetical protein